MQRRRIALFFIIGAAVCTIAVLLALRFVPLDSHLLGLPPEASVEARSDSAICVLVGEVRDIQLCQATDADDYFVGLFASWPRMPIQGDCSPAKLRLYVRRYFRTPWGWRYTDMDLWQGDTSYLSVDVATEFTLEFDIRNNYRFIRIEVTNRACAPEICLDVVGCTPISEYFSGSSSDAPARAFAPAILPPARSHPARSGTPTNTPGCSPGITPLLPH